MEPHFFDYIGGVVDERGEGFASVSLDVKAHHLNGGKTVHGGVLTALADTAMGVACSYVDGSFATLDMQYNFLRSAKEGDKLIAKGTVIKMGRTIMVTKVEIFAEDERIGYGTGTFYRFQEKENSDGKSA